MVIFESRNDASTDDTKSAHLRTAYRAVLGGRNILRVDLSPMPGSLSLDITMYRHRRNCDEGVVVVLLLVILTTSCINSKVVIA